MLGVLRHLDLQSGACTLWLERQLDLQTPAGQCAIHILPDKLDGADKDGAVLHNALIHIVDFKGVMRGGKLKEGDVAEEHHIGIRRGRTDADQL